MASIALSVCLYLLAVVAVAAGLAHGGAADDGPDPDVFEIPESSMVRSRLDAEPGRN